MMSVRTNIVALLATTVSLGLVMLVPEAHARDNDDNDNDDVEVTGPVEGLKGSCPNLRFTVNGKEVTTNDQTEFDDGTCANVRDGQRVEIEGRIKNGKLVAAEVDLK